MTEPQVDAVVEQAATLLRSRGDRMTGPRRAVIAALAGNRGSSHLTPDQVVVAVAALDPSVHRASVYRALEVLSSLGVVQHVHLGHGTTAYHLAAPHEHLHAHCVRCDRVIDLPGTLLDEVAQQVVDDYGFVLDPSHVALSGTCASCCAAG
ncbi:MAG TPA: transcriptional repressor [Actinomycetales bacterium]|nr:transcriptional repressor [Actinomycetales bacterium]